MLFLPAAAAVWYSCQCQRAWWPLQKGDKTTREDSTDSSDWGRNQEEWQISLQSPSGSQTWPHSCDQSLPPCLAFPLGQRATRTAFRHTTLWMYLPSGLGKLDAHTSLDLPQLRAFLLIHPILTTACSSHPIYLFSSALLKMYYT